MFQVDTHPQIDPAATYDLVRKVTDQYSVSEQFKTAESLEMIREIVTQEGSKEILPDKWKGMLDRGAEELGTQQQYENISALILDLYIDQQKIQGW